MTVPNAVCFDLDGVLVDTRRIHWEALNKGLEAVNEPTLTWEDHLPFDGLPTAVKLDILGVTNPLCARVKQQATLKLLQKLQPDDELWRIFDAVHTVGVASNAVRSTVDLCMKRLILAPTFTLSSEDVENPKPDPEIYLKAAELARVPPSELLVVEDKDVGVEAARAAGCQVLQVTSPDEVTLERIASHGR